MTRNSLVSPLDMAMLDCRSVECLKPQEPHQAINAEVSASGAGSNYARVGNLQTWHINAMHGGQETWIARPGDLILPSHAVPLSATRVGGLPTFQEGMEAPSVQLTTCRVCGKPMALLLQVRRPPPLSPAVRTTV